MQAASVLTFINKQIFIEEYETININLGQYSHEGYVFSLSKDNAIIKTVQGVPENPGQTSVAKHPNKGFLHWGGRAVRDSNAKVPHHPFSFLQTR